MRMVKVLTLDDYAKAHARASSSLKIWQAIVQSASWSCFNDVRATFGSADMVRLPNGRSIVVFNIAGNEYRLITAIHFTPQNPRRGRVYIREFLTHAEYDKNDWKERH
ncbi:type II toxin-antitoxin system HigB family toxin [Coraliomargarita parva]|uniref:type II toxin-antitoxin system HigB family toxin n=1 Tax=Coraliomargarita parva TaxID=3014050 RepID=UPI0031F32981